ncbi:MAG: hypothetical protein HQK65_17480 [Desulfamplus sp.]|nr:hypothetical protein [Desulfamplus sp.]
MATECPTCEDLEEIDCKTCDGKGRAYPLPMIGLGGHDCSECNGSGKITCPDCKDK